MNKTSKKQSILNNKKHKIKQELLLDNPYCSGCGTNHSLTLSHIIPVSQRKDLEVVKRNCLLDCLDCHNIWEHGTLEEKRTLNNFDERIEIIRELDIRYYYRFMMNRSK